MENLLKYLSCFRSLQNLRNLRIVLSGGFLTNLMQPRNHLIN